MTCHVTRLATQPRREQCGWAAKHGTQLCMLCCFLGTGLEEQKGDCAKRHYTSGAYLAQTRQGTRRAEKVIQRTPKLKKMVNLKFGNGKRTYDWAEVCAKMLNGEPACPSCTPLIRQTVVTSDWPEEFKALGGVNWANCNRSHCCIFKHIIAAAFALRQNMWRLSTGSEKHKQNLFSFYADVWQLLNTLGMKLLCQLGHSLSFLNNEKFIHGLNTLCSLLLIAHLD